MALAGDTNTFCRFVGKRHQPIGVKIVLPEMD